LKKLVDEAEEIILPFVVDAELKAGFHKGQKKVDNYEKLHKFENLDRVQLIWPDEVTGELYARIWSNLAKIGKPIPTNDVWIAAVCMQYQLSLATNDSHFSYVSLLETISY
jgi:predicted nucleic acid-binding protein